MPGKSSKILSGAVMAALAWHCGAFELNHTDSEGRRIYLSNPEFRRVIHRGLVFQHDDGTIVVKPEQLHEREQFEYSEQIKEYRILVREYKSKLEISSRKDAEQKRQNEIEHKKKIEIYSREFEVKVAEISKMKEYRFEEALRLKKKYYEHSDAWKKELDFSGLDQIIKECRKAGIKDTKIKDVPKMAYALILRIYMFKIADRVDKMANTPQRYDELTTRVRNMQDKLWRVVRTMDITDQVIFAKICLEHDTFVSGNATYPIEPPIRPLWQQSDSKISQKFIAGYFSGLRTETIISSYGIYLRLTSGEIVSGDNGLWNKYRAKDISSSDMWEFLKYLIKPQRGYGAFVLKYLKEERQMVADMLRESFLSDQDIKKIKVLKRDVIEECIWEFIRRRLWLKCPECWGTSIDRFSECRTCCQYGILLWRDYNIQTVDNFSLK